MYLCLVKTRWDGKAPRQTHADPGIGTKGAASSVFLCVAECSKEGILII
jgi:hypothetical protein